MNMREVSRGILWFAIGLVVAAVPLYLLLKEPTQLRDPFAIRTYPVRPEIAHELQSALNEALSSSTGGRANVTSDGFLVVTARESAQDGVQALLREVNQKKPEATPSIHFDVWLVSGTPVTGAAAENRPGLMEVAPALASIQKSAGPQRFELIERLALQARPGDEESQMQGAFTDLRVVPTVRRDPKGEPLIAAKINVRYTPRGTNQGPTQGTLKALTELRPGELLVIGQSSLAGTEPTAQMYYIVRASL
jgi:hypothetical protein